MQKLNRLGILIGAKIGVVPTGSRHEEKRGLTRAPTYLIICTHEELHVKLRRVEIENFRGIKELTWCFDSRFACLVGPGDSTKTTIVDAIGFALSSRYSVVFTDADFYGCDVGHPIRITVAVTDLPDKIIEQSVHGMNRSGIRPDGSLVHDPTDEDGVEECLLIQLRVDETLEPSWEVVRPAETEGARITASQRELLGFFRVGEYADTHLRWGKSSALTGVTNSKTGVKHAVVEAQRQARSAIEALRDTPLHVAASIAQTESARLGGSPFRDLRPGLDPRAGSGSAVLVLHDASVPLTNFGLGSRRLTSLAIQDIAIDGGSIVAVDELEHGLEPHRLAHFVEYLRSRAEASEIQVVFTTHSPVVVEMLDTSEIRLVRSSEGKTTVSPVPNEVADADSDVVQGVMRQRPSCLLAKRLVVGEGATECGFVKQLLRRWDRKRKHPNEFGSASAGVVVVNGNGENHAPKRARALAGLEFPTLLMIDGDVQTNMSEINDAETAGARIVRWSDGKALEDVVVEALPVKALQALIDLAADEVSEQSICSSVSHHLAASKVETLDVSVWIESSSEEAIRTAIAAASKGLKANGKSNKDKAWFKREDRGAHVAEIVFAHRSDLVGSELATRLREVKSFVYEDAKVELAGTDAEASIHGSEGKAES